jgi:diketogulonate reductase-like aldo/keto reductase
VKENNMKKVKMATFSISKDTLIRQIGQIILRFEIQKDAIVFPKSTNPERIKSNLEVFDFLLAEDEMSAIRALDKGKGMHDPDKPGVAEWLLANYKIHD